VTGGGALPLHQENCQRSSLCHKFAVARLQLGHAISITHRPRAILSEDKPQSRVEGTGAGVYESRRQIARRRRGISFGRAPPNLGGWGMQQRNEKVDEPSMEDILASIREIISEEPAPGKTGATTRQEPLQPLPLTSAASAAPQSGGAKPSDLPLATPLKSAAASPATPSRLSDIVRELAPSAVPVGASANPSKTLSFHDDLSDLVEGDTAETPAATGARPAGSAATVAQSTADRPSPAPAAAESKPNPIADLLGSPTLRLKPRQSEAAAVDLGAFVPATAEPIASTRPRASTLTLGTELRNSETGRAEAGTKAIALGVPLVDSGSTATARTPVTVADQSTPAASETVADPVAAAQTALGALAMGLATSVKSRAPLTPAPAYSENAVTATGRKTLDDTIVEMLRPLIREWLDANLPEMVEKALRQELSERSGAEH
jgi:cell pole-organizing protein PopZ